MQGGEDTQVMRGKVSWGGLRVAGLCIGVDEYKHIHSLGNAVQDAQEVDKALKQVPGCYSAVLRNPTTRVGLMKSIKRHVQEDALLDKPPKLFFFYYAGHGIEHKRRVYLVPGDAIVDDEDDLVSCVPLDEVMQMFVKELDTPVLKKWGDAGAITFMVVLDSCRVSLANSRSVDVDLEPEKPSCAPCKYRIIFSCSRTMPASDGQRGGHSPFAKAVLDADHGFFAEGIALNAAISKVSSTLKSMTKDQRMLIHGTADAISENFCIQPKAASESTHVLEVGMVSEGGTRVGNELTVFLEDHGFLPDFAAKISETMHVSVKHFLELKRGDIDMENDKLSFLERHHKILLLALVDRLESEREKMAAEKRRCEQDLQKKIVAHAHVKRVEEAMLALERKEIDDRKKELEKKEKHASGTAQVPMYWTNKTGFHRVASTFARTSLEKFMVESSVCCHAAQNTTVVSVERIENENLWQMYQTRKDMLRKTVLARASSVRKLSSLIRWQPVLTASVADLVADVNEFYLFHGTSSRMASVIAEHGFDERMAALTGLYGAGSYFASNACKSHQYSQAHKDSSDFVMLVCRVTMGEPYCTAGRHIQQRRPPDNPATPGRPFDSIFAESGIANSGTQQHNEYVVFDRLQVYPEFIVRYGVLIEESKVGSGHRH